MKEITAAERRLEIQAFEMQKWRVPIRVQTCKQPPELLARLRKVVSSIGPAPKSLRAIGWRVPASGRRIRFARFLVFQGMKTSTALRHD